MPTYGEKYGPAMKITDPQEAKKYFEKLVREHMEQFNTSREEAERLEKSNLGYYAGYYDSETMERVNRLFQTQHPVFGKIIPTPEEALKMGITAGNQAKGN